MIVPDQHGYSSTFATGPHSLRCRCQTMPSSWSRALPILGIVVILILLLVWPQHAGRKNTAFAKLQDAPVSAASHAAPQLPNALRTHNDSNISSSAPAPAPESGPGRRAEPSTALNRDTSSEFLPPTAASAPPPVPPDTVTWRVWYPEAKNLTWYPKPPKSLPQPWWNDITARTGSEKEALYPFKNIIDLQWPNGGSATACKAARTLEVHLHGYEGLFASINSVAACLALALHLNRTFIIRGGGSIYATEGMSARIPARRCLFAPYRVSCRHTKASVWLRHPNPQGSYLGDRQSMFITFQQLQRRKDLVHHPSTALIFSLWFRFV